MDKLEAAAGVDDSFKVKVKGKWRWQCNQCDKHYSTKYSLMTHGVGHSGLKPFVCSDCGKGFKQLSHLNTHQLRHAGLRPHCCTVCGKRFVQGSHLKRHMNVHNPESALYCDLCPRKFTYPSEVRAHKEKMHGPKSKKAKKAAESIDVKPVISALIDLNKTGKENGGFVEKENLQAEMSQKASQRNLSSSQVNESEMKIQSGPHWQCNQCPLTFPSQNELATHKTAAHQNSNGGFVEKENLQAEMSEKASQRSRSSSQVNETEMKIQSGPHWQCNKCPLTFPSQNELATHMTAAHQDSGMNTSPKVADDMIVDDTCSTRIDGIRRWKCKKCAKTYATKYGLITHMVDHSGTKPFECKDCGKRFKQLSHLNTHQLRHAGLRPHSCSVCGKRFVQASHLKRHMHTHTTEGAFFCDLCPRKFTYPSELRLHKVKAHTPGKPDGKERNVRKHVDVVKSKLDPKPDGASVIICPECGKSYNYQSQLDKHMKRHTNNRPHICKECGMQFMEIHHLNQHAFTHTGIKPHKCPVCSRGFTLEANMKRHLLIHSGIRNFECHLCRRRFAQKQTLRAHMIVHNDTKPHICKFCGKAFRRNRNLLCHLLIAY
ncbi:uncharacterized protein [Amphiura filiformis]|uniref:uncharacterized protein n=1 Tax=Amphiura filiformis TaxID=82378 RepID=UPI003B2237D5